MRDPPPQDAPSVSRPNADYCCPDSGVNRCRAPSCASARGPTSPAASGRHPVRHRAGRIALCGRPARVYIRPPPAGRLHPLSQGAPVNHATTLTNTRAPQNWSRSWSDRYQASARRPADVLDDDERRRFAAGDAREQRRLFFKLLCYGALSAQPAPEAVVAADWQRLVGAGVLDDVFDGSFDLGATPWRAGLPQRQQGQGHRLRAPGRDAGDLGPPAAPAARPRRPSSTCCTLLGRRAQVARLLGRARDAALRALAGRRARPLRLRARRPRAQARLAHGPRSTSPRRPTRSTT